MNIPAVFFKEEVFKFSKPFRFTKCVQPPNKNSIFSTLEELNEVKSAVSKLEQSVKVYIMLVIEGEFKFVKSTLIKSVHLSNKKSNEFKD